MFDATGLARQVETALNSDPALFYEEIRAASYVLVTLGRTFVWPVHDLDRHLELAATRLTEIRESGVYKSPEFLKKIDADIATLRSRIQQED